MLILIALKNAFRKISISTDPFGRKKQTNKNNHACGGQLRKIIIFNILSFFLIKCF